MLSIIICSISAERLKQLSDNVNKTIGIEYEIIAIDNTVHKWSIAKAYNEGARKAKFPYLLFVHEDISFLTEGWGPIIEDQLSKPDTGVIGFAGSKLKMSLYSGWFQYLDCAVISMYQQLRNSELKRYDVYNSYMDRTFNEVITLDGLALFVRRDVWENYPFDEEMLTGFHCYDLDFSLQIAAIGKYKNYVCCTPKVLICHFSEGNYNEGWFNDTIRLHRTKWRKLLPICTTDYVPNKKKERIEGEKQFNKFVRFLLRTDSPERWSVLKEFLFYSFSLKHIGHCIPHLYHIFVKKKI